MSSFLSWLAAAAGLTGSSLPVPAQTQPREEPRLVLTREMGARAEAMARADRGVDRRRLQQIFAPAKPPKGVVPDGVRPMAMDADFEGQFQISSLAMFSEDLAWLGYPYLAELSQRAEYRMITEQIAKDATRRWIEIKSIGEEDEKGGLSTKALALMDTAGVKPKQDKTDRIRLIEEAFRHHRLQDKFRRLAELDGFFGRGHLYINHGIEDRDLKRAPMILDRRSLKRGSLRDFKVVEPIWTYPGFYNSSKPLDPDFYAPKTWYVMSDEVHRTRFLTLLSRPVPDILKPAYAFGGLSMSQLAKPYVDNWLRTRQSVSDMIASFSVMGIKTALGGALQGNALDQIFARAQIFNAMRDSRGLMILDKETEEFFTASASLGSLDKLQAQSQEHMASVSHIPLIVLTGISPSGLNATSEEEIQVYETWIHSYQEHLFRQPIQVCLETVQIDLFGEIDPEIGFDFTQLSEMNDKERADLQKAEADRDAVFVGMGAISPREVRKTVANNPDLPYQDLDLDDVPADEEGFNPPGEEDGESGPEKQFESAEGGGGKDSGLAHDEKWDESKHPRSTDGKFGSGGGSHVTGSRKTLTKALRDKTKDKSALLQGEHPGPKPPSGVLASVTDENGYTIEIHGGTLGPDERDLGQQGRMVIKSPDGSRRWSALWMNWPENNWGISPETWKQMPWEQRASLEALQQATAYEPLKDQYEFWDREKYRKERTFAQDEDERVVPFTLGEDAFEESDHPRDEDGKFGSGGGGSSGSITRESRDKAEENYERLKKANDPKAEAALYVAEAIHVAVRGGESKIGSVISGPDGTPVAAGVLDKSSGEIQHLGSTEPGLGTRIMQDLLGKAKTAGVTDIHLSANTQNAAKFYEKFGFKGEGGFGNWGGVMHLKLAQDSFEESDHPRDEDGKFATGSGGGGKSPRSASLAPAITEGGKRTQADGSPLPAHVQKLKLPPAWTDVKFSHDPEADLLATGRDAKGRPQSVYHERFVAEQAAAKFARIEELRAKFHNIVAQNEEAKKSADPKRAEAADCLDLIMKMGIRPGSESDTGAEKKAYGATTLEGRHVVVDGDSVSLRFTGKKGVDLSLPVEDPDLRVMLRKRADEAGPEGHLFPRISERDLLDHTHSLDGGGFKTKDFRTHLGTSTAYDMVSRYPAPSNPKEYKRAVMEIAKHVSKKLGNTPVIALQSYINPAVFGQWRHAA